MGNILSLPFIQLAQRLSMILTLLCWVYVTLFLLSQNHAHFLPEKSITISPSPAFDLKPYEGTGRDIFSLSTDINPAGADENTPQGQLPGHLKIVGIIIADHPQIIIEDSSSKKTYFIDEGKPQDGIKIVRAENEQMIINYKDQDISVPINKNE